MRNWYWLLTTSLLTVLVSCAEDDQESNATQVPNQITPDTAFVADTIYLMPNEFTSTLSDTVLRMLELGGICSPDEQNMQMVLCSSDWFRVFPMGPNLPIHDGLICESRSLMFNGGISKTVLVLTRNSKGEVIRADHFLGKLLELRSTRSGYYDLVMSYRDSDVGTVSVLHTFEDGYYKPIEVLELNDYSVKEEYKDSLFGVYLQDFRWGH